jgi:ribonuclease HI
MESMFEYSFIIDGKKDINRAELAAIYVGLLISPRLENLEVLSDSCTALDLLNSDKINKYCKLVDCIKHVSYAKFNDCIRYTKVKSHSGVIGNEIAHNLARLGTSQRNVFNVFDEDINDIKNIVKYNIQKNNFSHNNIFSL